jgi:hypothetical protein
MRTVRSMHRVHTGDYSREMILKEDRLFLQEVSFLEVKNMVLTGLVTIFLSMKSCRDLLICFFQTEYQALDLEELTYLVSMENHQLF